MEAVATTMSVVSSVARHSNVYAIDKQRRKMTSAVEGGSTVVANEPLVFFKKKLLVLSFHF